jgi:uncharacterized membrane protein
LKTYFITGLIILLPLTLTVLIILFLFNILTAPFAGVVQQLLDHYQLLQNGFLFFSSKQLQLAVSQLIVLLFLFFGTVLLGFFARRVFFSYILKVSDYIFKKIPLVRAIYKTSQDMIKTVFTSEAASFKQVVLAPFPSKDANAIAFVTRDPFVESSSDGPLVAVFVPTTPNPTSGFLLLYRREELTYLDMTIEEAFKCIISCGIITTGSNAIKNSIAAAKTTPEILP